MYEAFYGLSSPPFQLNPDPAFYFNSRGHGHALAYLRYGVSQGEGFIVVTGEIGAGKTTLVRTLLDELDRQQVVAAQIVSTQLDSGDLLQSIITAFGIPSQGNSKAYTIATLEAFLTTLAAQGRRALLIVDEAQNLNPGAVEELRMLSNFQLGNHSLLQSFLVGQPELRRLLEMPTMEQLRQRITASCHLGPLDADETRSYIQHRLQRVGWNGRPAFGAAAFDELYRWSGGVPRRINRLANRVMLAAFLGSCEQIDPALVESTARELRNEIGEVGSEPALMPARPDVPPAVDLPGPLGDLAAPAASPDPVGQADPIDAAAAAVHAAAPVAVAVASTTEPNSTTDRADDSPVAAHPTSSATTSSAATSAAISAALRAALSAASATSEATPATLLDTRDDSTAAAVAADVASTDALLASLELDLSDSAPTAPDPAPIDVAPLHDLVRVANHAPASMRGALLALADDAATALKLAALAQALAGDAAAPSLVLVNPGLCNDVWPWDEMERLLPRPLVSLHLGVHTASFEQIAPPLFDRFGQILADYAPVGVLIAGHSEAMLACALLAHKRGLPVARLDSGDSPPDEAEAINALLIDQVAQYSFVCNGVARSGAASTGTTTGAAAPPARADTRLTHHQVAGSLLADVCSAIDTAITTPTGACLRNNLSIYLGPDWSSEVQGTPYAAVALTLRGDAGANALRIEALLACTGGPKLLWLVDAVAEAALRQWQAQAGALADQLFIVDGALSRDDARYRHHLANAKVLSCQVVSLPDQFSLLRGALAVVSEPGHLLGEVARLWQLPLALRNGDGHWVSSAVLTGDNDTAAASPRSSVGADSSGPAAAVSRSAHAATELALPDWLVAIAGAGYAARAAHAAISAAAGNRAGPATALPGAPACADGTSRVGAAQALARVLDDWLHFHVPTAQAIEA